MRAARGPHTRVPKGRLKPVPRLAGLRPASLLVVVVSSTLTTSTQAFFNPSDLTVSVRAGAKKLAPVLLQLAGAKEPVPVLLGPDSLTYR